METVLAFPAGKGIEEYWDLIGNSSVPVEDRLRAEYMMDLHQDRAIKDSLKRLAGADKVYAAWQAAERHRRHFAGNPMLCISLQVGSESEEARKGRDMSGWKIVTRYGLYLIDSGVPMPEATKAAILSDAMILGLT